MNTQVDRITVTRRIRATPERVYAFFTDSALWSRWQGTSAGVDPRPGGLLRIAMGRDGAGMAEGRFVELDPYERIVFTWGWVSSPYSTMAPGSTMVTVDLRPDGDGTLVTLTHDSLPENEREIHESGWIQYLGRLVTVAEGGDPGRDPSLGGPE
jgi:uncharacterized protein YndB with AHSA1/START domain